jgi:hypothetical protein
MAGITSFYFGIKEIKRMLSLTPGPSSHFMHNPHPGQLPGASPLADPSEGDPTSPLQPTGVNWAENDYADRALEGQ